MHNQTEDTQINTSTQVVGVGNKYILFTLMQTNKQSEIEKILYEFIWVPFNIKKIRDCIKAPT